jgi:hypothetical protein
MTNTKNTPVEALKRAYPMRVLRYRLRRGSGGAGRAPGGEGIERDVQVLEDCTVSLITERRVSRPWGLAGGEPGAAGENWPLPGGDEGRVERLPDKCTIRLRAGDVLRMLTPGGGGWGDRDASSERWRGEDRRSTVDLVRFERGEPERRNGGPHLAGRHGVGRADEAEIDAGRSDGRVARGAEGPKSSAANTGAPPATSGTTSTGSPWRTTRRPSSASSRARRQAARKARRCPRRGPTPRRRARTAARPAPRCGGPRRARGCRRGAGRAGTT